MRVDLKHSRERMVNESVKGKGVTNEAVLSAMRKVPRHLFVQEALANRAYDNCPQPIGHAQTISQPYIVGLMTELLEPQPGLRVLEIGTGSGYQAAILAEIGMEVYTVERIRELFLEARERLHAMKYFKIRFKLDDGTLGWPEQAPFDRIMVTAGGHSVPAPLLEQLADPGILVIPVGSTRRHQTLIQVRKKDGRISQEANCGVAFVDLVGAHGW